RFGKRGFESRPVEINNRDQTGLALQLKIGYLSPFMELPRRPRGDEYARRGRIAELTRRIAARPGVADIPVACFYAFDFRTRTLPFCLYDKRMSPAGMRAVAGAFHEAGFKKTRAVFQLWSPHVKPSQCRVDGKPIEILAV